jgi:hypothetical protein
LFHTIVDAYSSHNPFVKDLAADSSKGTIEVKNMCKYKLCKWLFEEKGIEKIPYWLIKLLVEFIKSESCDDTYWDIVQSSDDEYPYSDKFYESNYSCQGNLNRFAAERIFVKNFLLTSSFLSDKNLVQIIINFLP